MTPRLLGRENENWRQQSAERIEDFVHGNLGGPTAWRIRRVAVHPVFGDVDVQAAQVYRAEVVERVVNLVKLERFVCGSTVGDHMIEPLQNPAIDQGKILFSAFLLSWVEIVKIPEQNP